MRRLALTLLLLLVPIAARAQYVQQTGTVTPGHLSSWALSGILQDAGTATTGKVNSLGLYGNGGNPFCITNTSTPGPFSGSYSQFCAGISSTAAYWNLNGYGGASALPFNLNINGVPAFTVTGSGTSLPLTSGDIFVGNASNLSAPAAMSGDATLANTGAITVTKTNGTAFGSLATLGYDSNFTASGGNLAMANIATGHLLANVSGVSAEPTSVSTTALLDSLLGSTQGSVAYRNATGWTSIAPGGNGTYLQSQGAGTNPTWTTPGISLGTISVSTSGNPSFSSSDFMVEINNTIPAATTVYLEAVPAAGRVCVVKDGAGNAQTYNITVNGNGNNIDGQPTQLIRTNRESMSFAWDGTQWVVW